MDVIYIIIIKIKKFWYVFENNGIFYLYLINISWLVMYNKFFVKNNKEVVIR